MDLFVNFSGESRTQWHVKPESELTGEGEAATAHQGQQLLKNAASRVWEELYVSKRPALEEVFKAGLGTSGNSNQTPGLESVRETIAEPAGKIWHAYLDGEKRAVRTPAWEFQTQLESRIQRITGEANSKIASFSIRKIVFVLCLHRSTSNCKRFYFRRLRWRVEAAHLCHEREREQGEEKGGVAESRI